MKENLKNKIKLAAVLSGLAAPFLAAAQSVQAGLNNSGLGSIFGTSGRLTGATSLQYLIAGIMIILLYFAGIVAIVFVIIGGYQYVTSAGNEEQAEKGRKTLINAIIGIIVVVLAYTIINVIVNLVGT